MFECLGFFCLLFLSCIYHGLGQSLDVCQLLRLVTRNIEDHGLDGNTVEPAIRATAMQAPVHLLGDLPGLHVGRCLVVLAKQHDELLGIGQHIDIVRRDDLLDDGLGQQVDLAANLRPVRPEFFLQVFQTEHLDIAGHQGVRRHLVGSAEVDHGRFETVLVGRVQFLPVETLEIPCIAHLIY